jgi:hypothetical protein
MHTSRAFLPQEFHTSLPSLLHHSVVLSRVFPSIFIVSHSTVPPFVPCHRFDVHLASNRIITHLSQGRIETMNRYSILGSASLPNRGPPVSLTRWPDIDPAMRLTVDDYRTAKKWVLQLLQLRVFIEERASRKDTIIIDEDILDAPRSYPPWTSNEAPEGLITAIAHRLNPELQGVSPESTEKYTQEVRNLRRLVVGQRKRGVESRVNNPKSEELISWARRIIKQGAWRPNIADGGHFEGRPSFPMPVEMADSKSLKTILKHIARSQTATVTDAIKQHRYLLFHDVGHNVLGLSFKCGMTYEDGRIDFFGKALGPNNIASLMESMEHNTFGLHMLLGKCRRNPQETHLATSTDNDERK